MSPDTQRSALFESVVQNSRDLITVFDNTGTIVFINDACRAVFGGAPDSYVGRNIIEFVHPEELDRAVLTLQLSRDFGPAPGNTHFRLRRTDGEYVALEFTSGGVVHGDRQLMMTFGRVADARFALEQTLQQLLASGSTAEVMKTVCDLFSWRPLASRVSLVWRDQDGRDHFVTAGGLPDALAGANPRPGSPWASARESLHGIEHNDLSQLPQDLRAVAQGNGLGAYWIEPIPGGLAPGLITVWTVAGGRPPSVHVQGMLLARSIFELILRWTDQQRRLDYAAFHDDLTHMPNRKAFLRALEQSRYGAVLYCDLDRFKAVNDTFGHAAGDEVLRQVAWRLRSCLRDDDMVARVGGDEFGVLCLWSTAADAQVVVNRITAAIAKPFPIAEGVAEIGISIGIAHTTDRLDAASVAEADRALYAEKARRRAAWLAAKKLNDAARDQPNDDVGAVSPNSELDALSLAPEPLT
jgi:diguanylate cyclase (GGDEF)-like protein/PAS domain S-box-containing protein